MQKLLWTKVNRVYFTDNPLYFNFDECLKFLGRNVEESLFVLEDQYIFRLIQVSQTSYLIKIWEANQKLYVECLNVSPEEENWGILLGYVEEWLDLSRAIEPFYEIAKEDAILNPLIQAYQGLRLIRMPELFEAISWAIIGQQINLTFAYRLKKRWVIEANNSLEYDGEIFYTMPTPLQTLNISDDRFRELQFSRQKIKYIKIIAEQLEEGLLSKQKLKNLSFQECLDQLTAIKGIGPWTANYVMMKCLGITSAFPIQDVGIHNALKAQLNMQDKPSIKEIREMAKAWHPWEAYATFYLWRSLI